MSDYQRQKVYDAEQALRRTFDLVSQGADTIEIHNSTVVLPQEVRFGNLDGVQRYIDQVQATEWYNTAFPRPAQQRRVTVRQRKTAHKAHYEYAGATIAMFDSHMARDPRWAMREVVVLHELAHHVARDQHGPEFVGAFLFLIKHAMGPEAWLLAMDAFVSGGVDIKHMEGSHATTR